MGHKRGRSIVTQRQPARELNRGSGPGCQLCTGVKRVNSCTAMKLALLWVQLVKRSVHAHGHIQVVQSPVLADLVHNCCHTGPADLGGAAGHRTANLLDDDTVVAGAVQPQLLQDGPDLQQSQTIAAEGWGWGWVVGSGRHVNSLPIAGESPDPSRLLPSATV